MAYEQAKESFEIVLREVNSMIQNRVNNAQVKEKCDNIENEIIQLHSSLELCVEASKKEIQGLQNQLEQLNADEVNLTAQERELETKKIIFKAKKKKAEIKKKSLKSEIRSLKQQIDEAKNNSSWVFFDIFRAINEIVEGGCDRLDDICKQLEDKCKRLEDECKRLEDEYKRLEDKYNRLKRKVEKTKDQLSVIRNSMVRIGNEIKKRGIDLTNSGNALKGLEVSQNKFNLVKTDLFMIRECVDNDVFDEDIFNDFIRQFKDTQQLFLTATTICY